MNDLSDLKYHGLPMRGINRALSILSLLISVLLLIAAGHTASSYIVMRASTENYILWKQCVDDIETTSDYLTDQTRLFTLTGDLRYVKEYFREVHEDRRRDIALERLCTDLDGMEASMWAKIAVEQSKSLEEKEHYVMRLIAESYGYGLSELPEEISAVELKAEDAALSPERQGEKARETLTGENYTNKKKAISDTLGLCMRSLVLDTRQRQYDSMEQLQVLLARQRVLVYAFIAIISVVIVSNSLFLISPLVSGISHIQHEQAIPIRGAAEFRFLAKTYNMMFEANREKTERLAYEATHDKLTGLYNRSGYDFLMQNANLDTCALLLVDVDKFKNVNDTYGHTTGDLALVRVANVLCDSFRGEDYICRIGGDEFAVIMVNAEPEFAELIREKITRINETLLHPQNDLPPLSLSVGVAFGGTAHSTGHIAKDADLALYRVKEAGRCGCAFYEPGKGEK